MGTFRHVVVAVDGSEPSERATDFAVALAHVEGAHLSFCSAVDATVACMPVTQGAFLSVGPLLDTLDETARTVCRGAAGRAEAAGVAGTTNVLHGSAPHAVAQYARENAADAIVIGTHGRHGIARTMMGSVAAAVVRDSPIPVFCVHQQAQLASDGPIVVAVDGSAPSEAALSLACRLAHDFDARLHVVHVFDDRDLGLVRDHLGEDRVATRRRAMTLTSEQLDQSAERLRSEDVSFDCEVCEGRAVAEIIAAAQRVGARLIATGTHGRKALGRLVLGSVAEGLLRDARVPVVSVRA